MISALGPCRRRAFAKDLPFFSAARRHRLAGPPLNCAARLRRPFRAFLARDVAISRGLPLPTYLQTQADHSAHASHEERWLGECVQPESCRHACAHTP
jgi:hypothetical protein